MLGAILNIRALGGVLEPLNPKSHPWYFVIGVFDIKPEVSKNPKPYTLWFIAMRGKHKSGARR